MFQRGELAQSQNAAGQLARRYRISEPLWSAQFRVLEAQAASWRGLLPEELSLLSEELPPSADRDLRVRRLSMLAGANIYLHRYDLAARYMSQADALCSAMDLAACSRVVDVHWTLAMERGQIDQALRLSEQELAVTRRFGAAFEEAKVLMNRANTYLETDHYDEAIDWSNASNRVAAPLDAEDILLFNSGNLGWAYYSLGDKERAFALFEDAEQRAARLGDLQGTITWLTTSGYVLQDSGDWARAEDSYRQALTLARRIDSSDNIVNSLESLTHISIQLNRLDEAEGDLHQLEPMIQKSGNRLDLLDVTLARGRIAAARRQDQIAESLFHQVIADPASQITMRLGAEHELARLYETEARPQDAEKEYVTALDTFESARDAIKNEASKLPYLENATPIYDDYIRLLISLGKSGEALAAADQSRARTLEQGLGLESGKAQWRSASFHPEAIAARTGSGKGATLLFYWLGEKQSWLWAITPRKTALFPLPAQRAIADAVERYREDLLGPEDPLRSGNEDGQALYRMLVAPARDLIAPGGEVVVLCDGPLSKLNFETLPVETPAPHYWIDDADVVSAPSLRMLAAQHRSGSAGKLLLVGDALSPGPDYPDLPNAPVEMRAIEKHFAPQQQTVFARGRANAAAYLRSDPRRFAYIDFVAHGVASRTDPLDSAIILSRTGAESQAGEDSFRLYARDIMQHPLDARLVTIAACYGGGTRSYAGEGLVGLSWAFLRAGAHNVIGALWEVSDASAPRLMDALYAGLQAGLPPSEALRQAKLQLLHGTGPGGGEFRRPFYWGSFQLYTD